MKQCLAILCFFTLLSCIFAVTPPTKDIPPAIVDTLYLEREDCILSAVFLLPYGNPNNTYYIFGNPYPNQGTESVGDSYSFDEGCNSSSRMFFDFPITNDHEGYQLNSVVLKVLQVNSFGNSEVGVFPQWGQGENHDLLAAHVNFTQPLTPSSFTPAFCQNMGVISDNAVGGWKSLDVTTYYKYAKDLQNWDNFQIMMYFDILTDWDSTRDGLLIGVPRISSANIYTCPRLILTYQSESAIEDETIVTQAPRLSVYPNPADSFTNIKADGGYRISEISLYNLKGQRIESKNLLSEKSLGEFNLNTKSLSAGVYIIKSNLINGKDHKDVCHKLLIY